MYLVQGTQYMNVKIADDDNDNDDEVYHDSLSQLFQVEREKVRAAY